MSASTSNSNPSNAIRASTLFSRLAAQSDISFAQFLQPLEFVRFCFEDLDISPTEIVCVFWHALSANSGVIGNYLTLFFDRFDDGLEMIEEDMSEWIQYLIERFTVTEEDDADADAVGMDETA